jgi:hypothetical protein
MLRIKDIDWEKYKIEETEDFYVSYVEQKSKEWFELRKWRITGSIIGKILGDCMFNKLTYSEIASYIKGDLKLEFTEVELERMNKGNVFEDDARQEFKKEFFSSSEEKGKKLLKEKIMGICIWKKDERFASSPDGYFEYLENNKNIKMGLEIKCPKNLYKCVYPNYFDQMVLCKKVLNLDEMYFFVFSWETKEYYKTIITFEDEVWDDIYNKACKFYDKYM